MPLIMAKAKDMIIANVFDTIVTPSRNKSVPERIISNIMRVTIRAVLPNLLLDGLFLVIFFSGKVVTLQTIVKNYNLIAKLQIIIIL